LLLPLQEMLLYGYSYYIFPACLLYCAVAVFIVIYSRILENFMLSVYLRTVDAEYYKHCFDGHFPGEIFDEQVASWFLFFISSEK